jgi:hypothetical protein
LSFHTALFGETLQPFFMLPMFPNLIFVVVIWATWVVRFGRIPHGQLLYILILDERLVVLETGGGGGGVTRTFLFFLPPPPPLRFVPPRKPLMSSSNTMDGGLTFFPHPDLCPEPGPGTGFGSGTAGFDKSTRVGGAVMTAVADTVDGGALVTPIWENAASAATFGGLPVGSLGLRLTGAKASDADHPSD